jgi:hypothetical protein
MCSTLQVFIKQDCVKLAMQKVSSWVTHSFPTERHWVRQQLLFSVFPLSTHAGFTGWPLIAAVNKPDKMGRTLLQQKKVSCDILMKPCHDSGHFYLQIYKQPGVNRALFISLTFLSPLCAWFEANKVGGWDAEAGLSN